MRRAKLHLQASDLGQAMADASSARQKE